MLQQIGILELSKICDFLELFLCYFSQLSIQFHLFTFYMFMFTLCFLSYFNFINPAVLHSKICVKKKCNLQPCQKQSTWTDGSQTERLSESLFYENLGSDKNMYIYGMCAGGLPQMVWEPQGEPNSWSHISETSIYQTKHQLPVWDSLRVYCFPFLLL